MGLQLRVYSKYFLVAFISLVFLSSMFAILNFSVLNQNNSLPVNDPSNGRKNSSLNDVNQQSKFSSTTTVQGGNNFTTATVINLGNTNGSFTSSDGYFEYFKINLNTSSNILFTAITNPSYYFDIYNPSQVLINYTYVQNNGTMQIKTTTAGYYYVAFNRTNLTINGNFAIYITNLDFEAGSFFNTAINITLGTYTGNFIDYYPNLYFKIYVQANTDLIFNAQGSYTDVCIYNSSQALLFQNSQINPQINTSVFNSDYYYIRFQQQLSSLPTYDFSVSTQATGSLLYINGGNTINSAIRVPMATIQNQLIPPVTSTYYKIDLNSSNMYVFNFKLWKSYGTNNYLSFFNSTLNLLGSINPSYNSTSTYSLTVKSNSFYYFEAYCPYYCGYNIQINSTVNSFYGGNNFNSALVISAGNYSGYLTNNENSQYFKILVNQSYNIFINAYGEATGLFLYNSSNYLLVSNTSIQPSIRLSITTTDYYFIRITHSLSNWGQFNISVLTPLTGNDFYAFAGNSFPSATLISTGTTLNQFNGSTANFYKINLVSVNVYVFNLTILVNKYYNYIKLEIFAPNQTLIQYFADYNPSFLNNTIKPSLNGSYYIEITGSNKFSYKIDINAVSDQFGGGNNFTTSELISSGNYTGYLTNNLDSIYYKIEIQTGYDLIVHVSGGNNDGLSVYNSTGYLIGQDLGINSTIYLSIRNTNYYYIRIQHSTSNWGIFTLIVNVTLTGTQLFIDGGNSLGTAIQIPLGNYLSYFSKNEQFDYYLMYLQKGSDLEIVTNPGIFVDLLSLNYDLATNESLNSLNVSITTNAVYYLEIIYIPSNTFIFNINLTISPTRYIFYPEEGSTLTNPSTLPNGTDEIIVNPFARDLFCKIDLIKSYAYVFTLSSLINIYNEFYVNIYDSQGQFLHYYYNSKTLTFIFKPDQNNTYIIEFSTPGILDYKIDITNGTIPAGPTNINAKYSVIDHTLTITWKDSVIPGLNYFIYESQSLITSTVNLQSVGNVKSGIQYFILYGLKQSNYYVAVVANNSLGISSNIQLGVSSTSYPAQITSTSNSNPPSNPPSNPNNSYSSNNGANNQNPFQTAYNEGKAIAYFIDAIFLIIVIVIFSAFASGSRKRKSSRRSSYNNDQPSFYSNNSFNSQQTIIKNKPVNNNPPRNTRSEDIQSNIDGSNNTPVRNINTSNKQDIIDHINKKPNEDLMRDFILTPLHYEFCSKCGFENSSTMEFCNNCGAKLTSLK